MLYPPGLEFIAAFLGCLYAGATAVPAYPPRLRRLDARLQGIVEDCQPYIVLTNAVTEARAEGLMASIPGLRACRWLVTDTLAVDPAAAEWKQVVSEGDTIALLQYTSGSTGAPKGVMVTHANLLHNQEMIRRAFDQSEASVIVGWLPLYHDMGLLGNVLQPLYLGARCILMPPAAFLQKPVRWLEAISRYRGTTSGGPNFAYDLCVRRVTREQRAGLDLSSWRVAFNGAEPVRQKTLEGFSEAFASCGFRSSAFYPCYGLAEATLFAAGGRVGEGASTVRLDGGALERGFAQPESTGEGRCLVACGGAWLDQEIAVVDPESGAERSTGDVGEIWVSGPSVAAGYWGRPEESELLFRSRLANRAGTFLRTGDLGVFDRAGLLVTGRLKDLIIIRGRNHYPQDVEATAEGSCSDVRPGASAAFSLEVAGEERLVVVAEVDRHPQRPFEEIAGRIAQEVVREHDVAVHEVVLIRFGTALKTSSGKIRRRACRAAYQAGELDVVARSPALAATAEASSADAEAEMPPLRALLLAAPPEVRRRQLELHLVREVARVARIPAGRVDLGQPPSGLGVDSLAAIELQQSLEEGLGLSLSAADLLDGESLSKLAERLAAGLEGTPPTSRGPFVAALEHPLSHGQRGLWFLERLEPASAAYNLASAVRTQELDCAALRRAVQAISDRHPALRTFFEARDGEPVARIREELAVDFATTEAAGWSAQRQQEYLAAEAFRPLDLEAGPPLRVRVLVAGRSAVILLVVHHIVADLWSLAIVARELGELYRQETGGAPARLAPLARTYGDWTREQQERLAGPQGERLWAHWRGRLAGELPILDLPADRPRGAIPSPAGGARHLWLSPALLAGAQALAQAQGTTLFTVLLAAFQALLHRYSGQRDFLIGAPTAGREGRATAGLVGYFVSPVALRSEIGEDPSFGGLLAGARSEALAAFGSAGFPLPLLMERLRPGRGAGHQEVFQTLLVLQQTEHLGLPGLAALALGAEGTRLDLGPLSLESVSLVERRVAFDLTLIGATAGESFGIACEYRAALFDPGTIDRLLRHFETLLTGAVADPRCRVAALPLLPSVERRQVLAGWNRPARQAGSPRRLDQLFAAQVERTPDAPALWLADGAWTYRQLDRRVNGLAHRLRRLGVGAEARVGVFLDRRPELVVTLMAILKAGGAYVPLDPAYPAARIEAMLCDAAAQVVVTRADLAPALPQTAAEVVSLVADQLPEEESGPRNDVPSEGLAYLIYTSGSTGRPKASAISHANAVVMVRWALSVFSPDELARTLFATSISFDISVFEYFAPLSSGGCLVLARDILELPALAAAEVTLVNTVPSALAELVAGPGLPASVRVVNLAGEPLPLTLTRQLYAFPGVRRVVNLYGPSEDTTFSTFSVVPREGDRPPAIGRPIDEEEAYVLDREGEPAPIGIPGELYLGGSGVSRGYFGRPALTAERFVPDPWSGRHGARLYRSGDLVRWRADGELEFLGRLDHQVKVRGFRIEPGEIEAVLRTHPDVQTAAVVALPGALGHRRLVAYIGAPGGEVVVRDLRDHARRELPEHMVPAAWVILDALPLTPSGKLDRKALPAPESGVVEATGAQPPAGPFEELLAALWCELLERTFVARGDSFFELGGHSLVATRLAARIRDAFRVELPLSALFASPVLADMAAALERAALAPRLSLQPIRSAAAAGPHPASFAQRRLWFLDQLDPGGSAYNVGVEVGLEGVLEAGLLRSSLSVIAGRHEALRTVFVAADGEPFQVVTPALDLALATVDLAELPAGLREGELVRLLAGHGREPFDLARGPLLRTLLLRVGERDHRLAVVVHHIVADGWSLGVFVRELAAFYAAFADGRIPALPELPIQYADFARWQHEQLAGEPLETLLAYWRRALAGAGPALDLPVDRSRHGVASSRGARRQILLEPALAAALDALCRRERATPYMLLLAVFVTLLGRYSRQDDIVVGTPVANRSRAELEGLIGFFTNTLVLRARLAPDLDFRALLAAVRATALAAYSHQDLPFELLVQELQPEPQRSGQPLFQSLFAFQNFPLALPMIPGLALEHRELDTGAARFDLSLFLAPADSGLVATLAYALDLFDDATAERLLGHFRTLAAEAVAAPSSPLATLSLLQPGERHQVAYEWSGTPMTTPGRTVYELFATWVERTPDAPALRVADEVLTYAELGGRAGALAARLVAMDVGPEVAVGLCLGRTTDAIVGILAVFAAGGAYVPLDPAFPRERLATMLEDAAPRVVVTRSGSAANLPAGMLPRLLLLDAPGSAGTAPLPRPETVPGNPAYIIFTSGSTGRPKGVVVEHRHLASYLCGMVARLGLPAGSSYATVSTIAADLGNTSIYAALATGGLLHLIPEDLIADAERLAEYFDRYPVDSLKIVPSHLAALLRPGAATQPLPRLRLVLGGEAASAELIDQVQRLAPGLAILNHYGPTETTVGVLVHPVASRRGGSSPPLGRPLAGARVSIVDAGFQPVPAGVPGELLIGGESVARGYVRRPELTAERFVPAGVGGAPGERVYRTGDLARWLPDGAVEFLGRIDHQVKIRGFRIEPQEIESRLAAHPGVRQAVVTGSSAGLVAYVVAAGAPPEATELRAFLRQRLPEPMVPGSFVFLAALPLTGNGKVDRRALPAPERRAAAAAESFTPPRTEIEAAVAAIWEEVLESSPVGVHDGFFELGGHSLLATRVISRVRSTLKVEVSLRTLFERPTLADFAAEIECLRAAPALLPPILPGTAAGSPLSFSQERLWLLSRFEGATAAYNLSYFAEIEGLLDVAALAGALREVIRRHAELSAAFPTVEGAPVRVFPPRPPFVLPVVDLTSLPSERARTESHLLAREEARRTFDLAAGPLLRAALLRLGRKESLLLLSLHHMVCDAWSRGVLLGELAALYPAFASRRPSPLPEPPIQYADYARWQRQWWSAEALAPHLAFWRRQLAEGDEVLDLPADRPRPTRQRFRGARVPCVLPAAGGLAALCRQASVTPFMVLLGIFQLLLHRYSCQDRIRVGVPIANRTRQEAERLVGFLVNTLVLEGRFDDRPSFHGLLARVREATLDAYTHQDLPFEKLVEAVETQRDLSRSPLFQVVFVLQNAAIPELRLGELALSPLEIENGTAKFDLTLALEESPAGTRGWLEYDTDRFDPATATRLLGHFSRLLEAALSDPGAGISEVPLMTTTERWELLLEWNDSRREVPGTPLVHEQFRAHARRRPEALAVISGDRRLTYGELEARSNRLAHHLVSLGVGPDVVVGVCAERTLERVVGIVATLKAGGAYASFDPAYPKQRLALAMADARVPVLLTESRLLDRVPESAAAVICFDRDLEGLSGDVSRPPGVELDPANLAYVIFTSGSTGRPKGVAIPHRGLRNMVRWHHEVYAVTREDLGTQVASPAFDLSVWELWPLLAAGAGTAIPDEETRLSPALTMRWWAEAGITLAFLPTPLADGILSEETPRDLDLRLRYLVVAGDRLHRAPLPGTPFRLSNVYGPAEYSVVTTMSIVPPPPRGAGARVPTLGRVIANTRIYVLDMYQQPVPIGVPGELYVDGEGLARGYLWRPELTAERFLPDPFWEAGSRMYRTGDLVRWLPDGELDFLGRIDHQVKIRGMRVELGEIESVLGQNAGVREAVVLVQEGRMNAYLVGVETAALTVDALRGFLKERLPSYMVPDGWLLLDALPLTPNGKVDRGALARLEVPVEREGYLAPRTELEAVVAKVWEELLGVDRVGVQDDFFRLGGHSLLASRLLSRLQTELGIALPMARLFEAPTVAALAAEVVRERGVAGEPFLRGREERREAPLSFGQERLFFLEHLEPGGAVYNVPFALRCRGPLAAGALARALFGVVARHQALRTTFVMRGAEPLQRVTPPARQALPVIDFSALPPEAATSCAARVLSAEAELPFDLGGGPLLRVTLLRLEEHDHYLVVVFHHIVCDGRSIDIFLHELSELYGSFATGRPPSLPPLAAQYPDFALWQRRHLRGEVLAEQSAYWRRQLAGLPPVLELPVDRPRPPRASAKAGRAARGLATGTSAALRSLGRSEGASLFMVLLAACEALLGRWTGREDVAVGTPIAGRTRQEVEGLIGFFVNSLVLRLDLGGAPDFRELLRRSRDTCLSAYANQELPFEKLVEELHPRRDLAHTPLFQVLFLVPEAPAPVRLEGVALEPLDLTAGTTKFDLTWALLEVEQELSLNVDYRSDLFEPATVERWLGFFATLVEAAIATPERRLSDLPLFSESERRELLTWADGGALAVAPSCLHELVAMQAARTPGAVALVTATRRLTYGELEASAGRLAAELRTLGVGPEVPVAVLSERTAELVVALLAVLKAGGAYVPLDPAYPRERIAYILADVGAPVLLTEERLLGRLPAHRMDVVLLGRDGGGPYPAPPPLRAVAVPENLAYVIYTSGSTGRPKGVAITHRSAAALLGWVRKVFAAEEMRAVFAATSICFDLSVFELFAPLSCGGRIVLGENALALASLPRELTAELTLVNTVPSAMSELMHLGALPASVETVCLAGEPLRRALVDRIYATATVERVLNLYGPSEDTTYSTWVEVPRTQAGEPTIGRPVSGTQAYVVDGRGQPQPVGVPGELWLAGAGLARGYFDRPELTAERFVPDPFGSEPGGRAYRTGDLARWRGDRDLEFLGRIDHQVKVRGFRIELGEIESALVSLAAVTESVVVAREDGAGERRLVAYVVAAPGATPEASRLRSLLQERLPEYMVPSSFVVLAALPLTPNGKVDRKALPAPELGSRAVYVAPRTPAEEVLAGIWGQLLGLDRVSVEDDFFALGGQSLLIMRLASRVREAFGIEVPLRRFFERSTLGRMAALVGFGRTDPALSPFPRVAGTAGLRLSFAQERIWLLEQLEPGTAAYNMPCAVVLRGPLDAGRLAGALGEVVRRHEVLRATFLAGGEGPRQSILPSGDFRLGVVDLSALPPAERAEAADRLGVAEALRPFDLKAGPPFRATLARLAPLEHRLFLTVHHIAADGWSMALLLDELTALYRAAGEPGEALPPALPVRYVEFAEWQRRSLEGDALDSQLAYWRRQLAGPLPGLDLPVDRRRSAESTFRGGRVSLTLAADLSLSVEAMGRRAEATLFMTLLTAFALLLGRQSGQEDLIVGTPIAGRNRSEVEGLIGIFLNMLALRLDLSGGTSFAEALARTRETALAAYAHQDLPFERVVREVQPEREAARAAVFQVLFNLLDFGVDAERLALPEIALELLSPIEPPSKFDLTLYVARHDRQRFRLDLVYNADLFDPPRMGDLVQQLASLLEQAAADPTRRIAELELRTDLARAVLPDPRAPLVAGGAEPVFAPFVRTARRVPERVAVVDRSGAWSYGELDAASDRLARFLEERGVGGGEVVAIYAARSASLVAALLGVLKAGAAFAVLDAAYPAARLLATLERARPSGWLALEAAGEPPSELTRGLAGAGCRVRLDLPGSPAAWTARLAGLPVGPPAVTIDPDDLAYVAFTSGSTGVPKGILGSHRPLAHFLEWHIRTFGLVEEDRFSLLSGLAHDPLLRDVFTPLWLGATLLVPDPAEMGNGTWLAAWLRDRQVSVVHLTPGLAQLLSFARPAEVLDAMPGLPALRYAFFGGEPLTRRDVDVLRRLAPEMTAVNFYGTTETPQAMGWHVVAGSAAGAAPERLPVGRGIEGAQLLVVSPHGRLAAIGEVGEIHVRTPYLTRGYLGDEELTRERYVASPWGREAADRLYRTGDLGRFLPDGGVELLGRRDGQVKLRGFRIELSEVEAVLALHPSVRAVAATVRETSAGPRLLAYVVAAGERQPAAGELRAHLARRLPDYMIPAGFIPLSALPLTPNGKLDRQALPESGPDGEAPSSVWSEGPGGTVEEVVAVIVAELLGVERVGPEANFFELGGHSLLAAQLIFRLEQAFEVGLSLRALLATPTVAGMAAVVAVQIGRGAGEAPSLPRYEPVPGEGHLPFPLTDIQQAYWIGRAGIVDHGRVSSHRYLELEGELDLTRLENAWRRLIDRHDMLRAVVEPDGQQRILPEVPSYVIAVEDLTGLPPVEAAERLAALREEMSHQSLAADRWPLFDVRACRLPGGQVRLFLSFDYLLADAWSFQILLRELLELYVDPLAAQPRLGLSFRDYVLAEHALRQGERFRRAREHWLRRLDRLPPGPELPLIRDPGQLSAQRFVRRHGRLEPEPWRRLKARGARLGLTPSGLLLAAFSEILGTWTRSPRFTLVLTLFNRLPFHPDVNRVVGDFTTTTLLEVDLAAASFERRAKQLQERLWEDLDHRQFSGVQVLREMASRQGGLIRGATQVVFTSTLDVGDLERARPAAALPGRVVHSVSQTPQVLLDHQVTEREGGLEFNWDAVDEVFPPGFLDEMFALYGDLMLRLATAEEPWRQPVLGLVSERRHTLERRVNDTAGAVPAGLLHQPFELRASISPGSVAVWSGGRTLDYEEVDQRVEWLARRLMRRGLHPDTLVAVVMEKGWEQVVAVLAILRAGAAYLPVDAEVPAERLAYLLRNGGVEVALTQSWLDGRLAWPEGVARLPVDTGGRETPGARRPDPVQRPDNLAYVIFTSGSTGHPKGVMIDHRGSLNTIVDVNERFNVGPEDRVLALSALNFDLSVYDVFGLLGAGGAVVLPEPGAARDPARWAELIERAGVSVWNTVPALLEMLVEYLEGVGGSLPPGLRLVLLSGDWIPVTLPARLRALAPAVELISMGGATEASIWSILYPVGEVRPDWRSVPYGRAMRNQTFRVLDRAMSPSPCWVPGDLYIGGIGLARGYWRDPVRTAASFVVDAESGERLYRTGDLGRLLPDGDIEFLGREDFQVKIQGQRIELGEIEAALSQHPAVRAAAVNVVGPARGARRLVAYVVREPAGGGKERAAAGRLDPLAALEFKLRQPGLRQEPDCVFIDLEAPETAMDPIAAYERRRSHRAFSPRPVSLARLSALLASLAQIQLPGRDLPGYQFPSAGSLYPVQAYVHVKPGRVHGISAGGYYYDPRGHRLVELKAGLEIDRELHSPVNRATFDECAFSVFLVADLDAIAPVYGEMARDFCLLEAGYVGQLLMAEAKAQGLGLCPIGRLDFQPLRYGLRLKESHLLVHSLVGGSIEGVAAGNGQGTHKRVAAPVSGDPDDPAADLRAFVAGKLPPYMVPAAFVLLPALPLTANGKVDRRALPLPQEPKGREEGEPGAASEVEKAIAAAWRQVLGRQAVGRNENFFELGGNSVAMVRVYNQLRVSVGPDLPLVALFEQPTIAALARYLGTQAGSGETAAPGIEMGQDRAVKRKEAARQRAMRRGGSERSGDE